MDGLEEFASGIQIQSLFHTSHGTSPILVDLRVAVDARTRRWYRTGRLWTEEVTWLMPGDAASIEMPDKLVIDIRVTAIHPEVDMLGSRTCIEFIGAESWRD